jgi:hypothetical protein
MSEERKKAHIALWCVAVFFAVLAYPASFGPACWVSERAEDDGKVLSFIYGPLIRIAFTNKITGEFAITYLKWGIRRNAEPLISIREGAIRWTGLFFNAGPYNFEEKPNRLFERPRPPGRQFGGGGFGGSMGAR